MGKKRKARDGKRVDVSEVVDGLRAKRDKEAAPPTSLFRVETKPTQSLTVKERKERARSHVTHVDRVLLPDDVGKIEPIGSRSSALQRDARAKAAVAKRNTTKLPGASEARKVAELARKIQAGIVEPARAPATAASRKRKRAESDVGDDPWAIDLDAPLLPDDPMLDSFAKPAQAVYNLKKRPKPLAPASRVPAVQPAHAGQSYRPTDAEHQDFLGRVVAQEKFNEREKARLDARMSDEQKHAVVRQRYSHLVPFDMMRNPAADEEASSSSGEPADGEPSATTKRKRAPERKTRAQRRRQLRNQVAERRRLAAKALKRMHASVNELKAIKRAIDAEAALRARRRAALDEMIKNKAGLSKKKLGRHRVREPAPAFLLSGEIPSSLRTLKVDRGLLQDRVLAWEHRNIVEVMATRKKHEPYRPEQIKRYVKETFRGTSLAFPFQK